MPQKNILFLMTDEHRWDYAGYMGHPLMAGLTPNLDRLASEGGILTLGATPHQARAIGENATIKATERPCL